jgi:hypothetical protein
MHVHILTDDTDHREILLNVVHIIPNLKQVCKYEILSVLELYCVVNFVIMYEILCINGELFLHMGVFAE